MHVLNLCQTSDVHVEEDRYFGDTAQCLELFVVDAIGSNVDLFVIKGRQLRRV